MNTPATAAELDRAKSRGRRTKQCNVAKPENAPDPWLDMDTYRMNAVQDQIASLRAVTLWIFNVLLIDSLRMLLSLRCLRVKRFNSNPRWKAVFNMKCSVRLSVPAPTAKPPAKPASNNNPM